jgi:Lrp/AsnC family transcriptional regulator, leucine-responsive regulatory protein
MNKISFKDLDEIDVAILERLQQNGRISHTQLAQHINLSQPAIHNRIRQLEKLGFIQQYVTLLDREQMGYDLLCFIHINIQVHSLDNIRKFREAVTQLPQVLECHHLTGSYDYLLKVVLRNRKDLEYFAIETIVSLPGVKQVQTSLVLSEVKRTTALPLD